MRWRDSIKTFARPMGAVVLSAAGPALGGALVLGLAYANSEALRGGGLGLGALLLVGGVLGRVDDMRLVRGVNVYPSAVDAVVRRGGHGVTTSPARPGARCWIGVVPRLD